MLIAAIAVATVIASLFQEDCCDKDYSSFRLMG